MINKLHYTAQDPEVSAAFMDVSQNPANISKYQDNPKIQRIIQKLSNKFGGAPGGMGEEGQSGGSTSSEGSGGAPPPSGHSDLGVD